MKNRIQEYLKVWNSCPKVKAELEGFIEQQKIKESPVKMLYILVIVPAIIAFINSIFEIAKKEKKTRLYFLSRDGYQMYLIAKRLVELDGIPIECKYINVSRYSMRIPGYFINIDDCFDSICVGGIDVTPLKILKRAGLTERECEEVLCELKLEEKKNEILNYRQIQDIKKEFSNCEKLKNYIYSYSMAEYKDAIGYLEQEGLCKDSDYLLVDSGWIGTLQCSIEKLVRSVNPNLNIIGCYFGMYEYPMGKDENEIKAFYFDKHKGLKRKSEFSNSLFEAIVTSEEAMTLGYSNNGDSYVPVFNKNNNPNEELIRENINLLKLFLQKLDERGAKSFKEISTNTIEKLFQLFMANPTDYEVKAYGNCLFSDDVLDDKYGFVAANLKDEDIKNQWLLNKALIYLGIKKQIIHESAWIEGSIVRAKKDVNRNLRHIRLYKYLLHARKQLRR